MRNQKLYESVGKYIDKYYIDRHEEDADIEIDESAVESFDVESMQKTKATDSMSLTLATSGTRMRILTRCLWKDTLIRKQDEVLLRII